MGLDCGPGALQSAAQAAQATATAQAALAMKSLHLALPARRVPLGRAFDVTPGLQQVDAASKAYWHIPL